MFKSFIILYFLCVATLSITAQTDSLQQQLDAYKNAPEYVKEGMPSLPDASRFLPAPTDENDTRFVSDSCMYEWGKTFRGTLRGDTAIADAGYAIAYFLKRFSPAHSFFCQ